MKILLDASVISQAPEKGAQRYARGVAEALASRPDVELTVIVREGARAIRGVSDEQTHLLPHTASRSSWLLRGLPQLCRARQPEGVIVAGEGPVGALEGIPSVIAVHELPARSILTAATRQALATEVLYPVVRSRLRRAPRIATLSSFMAGYVIHSLGLKPDQVHVVRPGVADVFRDKANAQGERGNFALLMYSEDPRESPELALRALAQSRAGVRTVTVAGSVSGAAANTLQSQANALGIGLNILGRVTDQQLRELYATAAFYVDTSVYEGYGLQVAEASSMCCPILPRATPMNCELGFAPNALWASVNDLVLLIDEWGNGDRETQSYLGDRARMNRGWHHTTSDLLRLLQDPEVTPPA